MSIILICGHPLSDIETVQTLLTSAGLVKAHPSKREKLSPAGLTSKMLRAEKIEALGPDGIAQVAPGRVLEAFAIDLLIANLDEPNWGWSDSSIIYFLDFWRNLDPHTRFCLVYSSAEYALANLFAGGVPNAGAIEQALAQWSAYNKELLRFYAAHKDRSLLVNVEAIRTDPRRFLAECRDGLEFELLPVAAAGVASPNTDAVALLVASALLDGKPHKDILYQELESSADLPLTDKIETASVARLASAQHNEALGRLKQTLEHYEEAKAERDEQKRQNSQLLVQLDQAAEKLCELERQLYLVKSKGQQCAVIPEEFAAVKKRAERAEKQNTLLEQQLIQVEEELEYYFFKSQEAHNGQDLGLPFLNSPKRCQL